MEHRKRRIGIDDTDRFGFSEQASFARYFKKHTGVTPSEYREGK